MSDRPRVLLLGDSIRMSYQPAVRELLADEAEVVGPGENGQFALYTQGAIDRWLPQLGTPDVVHWNNGLHDVGHRPNRCPHQIPLEMYAGELPHILWRLRETGADVIWATTTPVHPDRPWSDTNWSWRNAEIDAYNIAALKVMRSRDVPINDLHALVAADYDRMLCPDQLHLSAEGVRTCAAAVAAAVRTVLQQRARRG